MSIASGSIAVTLAIFFSGRFWSGFPKWRLDGAIKNARERREGLHLVFHFLAGFQFALVRHWVQYTRKDKWYDGRRETATEGRLIAGVPRG